MKYKISKEWCEKSARLEAQCSSVEAGGPSVEAPPDPQAHSSAFAVAGMVGLRVESAEALCRDWDARSAGYDQEADKHYDNKEWAEGKAAASMAEVFETCARMLRRKMAAENVRQPEPNTKVTQMHSEDGASNPPSA